MNPILVAVTLAQKALEDITRFDSQNPSNTNIAHTTDYVQDAMLVLEKVIPLIQQFGAGQGVTQPELNAVLRRMPVIIDRIAYSTQDSELRVLLRSRAITEPTPQELLAGGESPIGRFDGEVGEDLQFGSDIMTARDEANTAN